MKKKANNSIIQFIKFGIVGLSNTVLGYIIYTCSLFTMKHLGFSPQHDYLIAQFLMFLLTVLWSFYWNNKMVFKGKMVSKRSLINSLIKTYISYALTTLFLSEILLILWVKVLGINEFLAPIISLLLTVPLNFFIQKLWVFKNNKVKAK